MSGARCLGHIFGLAYETLVRAVRGGWCDHFMTARSAPVRVRYTMFAFTLWWPPGALACVWCAMIDFTSFVTAGGGLVCIRRAMVDFASFVATHVQLCTMVKLTRL